jgi:hypothetical protein
MDFEKMANFKNTSICYKLFGNTFAEQELLNTEAPEVKDLE